jgi:PadR family transcriptional regulator, regulatory protein PadR
MLSFRRPSGQTTTAVVLALAEQAATWRYGYELCQRLGLRASALYPALMRLADRGLLETTWERDVPPDRRPRHLYRLTGPGRALAGRLAAEPPAPPNRAWAVGEGWRRPRLGDT